MYSTDKKNERLLITEIERAALHDGPGIRTTIFLAGCPLHCPWCCNPETQQCKIMLMHDADRCIGCGNCVATCPTGTAFMKDGKPVFDRNKCSILGECLTVCPSEALSFSGKYMAIEEVIEEVLHDRDYYEATGGGITLSGGEPFFQSKGALRLLELSKLNKLHTVVETTACVNKNIMRKAISLVDLFLIDFKHVDADLLKEVTGADFNTIYTNIQMLVSLGADVCLRTPVIPGFNNNPDTIQRIFRMVKELGVSNSVLLPYHSLGKNKYKKLSLPYPMGDIPMLSERDMIPLAEIGRSMGINVTIGG